MKITKCSPYSAAVGVDLAEIDPDLRPASQMRVRLDDEAVERYAETFEDLPPVKLIYDAAHKKHWLADGCHTIHAARHLGRIEIRAEVRPGSRLDAFKEAAHANQTHGVRVTNADKRHRVEEAVRDEEMKGWSNRRIAEACGVHHQIVGNLRPDPGDVDDSSTSNGTSPTRTDTKGRRQPATKPRKPKSSPAAKANGRPATETRATEAAPADAQEDAAEVANVNGATPGAGVTPGDEDPIPPEFDLWERDPDEPDEPETDREDLVDWGARWSEDEAAIMAIYHAWPSEARALFVMNLITLGHRLRTEKHAHEIIDRSGEKF